MRSPTLAAIMLCVTAPVAAANETATAPAADFGAAAAACAVAVGPSGLELGKLDPLGWTPIPLGEADAKNFAFSRNDSPVRIFLSTSISPKGQCVVDGFAQSPGQFGAIAKSVENQIGVALGTKAKSIGKSKTPDGYSQGAGFIVGETAAVVSSERQPRGMNVRVTVMRLDPKKDPRSFAMEAAMAAQFLPYMVEVATMKRSPKPASTPSPQSTKSNP